MKAYKGFDKDLKCRGYQYQIGGEYTEDSAELCKKGFHACELPHDIFNYYAPAESRFCEVDLDTTDEKNGKDSKRVGTRIKIGAEISVFDIAKISVKAFFDRIEFTKKIESSDTNNAGDCGAANVGNYGAANAGYRGAAVAGYRGAANAGNYGAANAGDYGAANAGDYGAANAGDCGAANAGDYGVANAGNCGAANAGNYGAAVARDGGKAKVGKGGVAVGLGKESMASGAIGAVLVLTERDDDYNIINAAAVIVDGETVKADTYYAMKNGEIVEAQS